MQQTPRTLPLWVHTVRDDDVPELPHTPDNARLATPNLRGTNPRPEAPRGRKLDHARTAELPTISTPITETAGRWKDYMHSTTGQSRPSTGRTVVDNRTVVDDDWMAENWPYNFDEPWEPQEPLVPVQRERGFWLFSPEKRKKFLKRAYWQLMNNAFVPLLFRVTILSFSVLALGLAGNLFKSTAHVDKIDPDDDEQPASCRRLSSTYMAIVYDVVAILYVVYITVDEYTSEPLGLRSHSAKMRLIFLDLVFIVFNSANLALAFEPLFDTTWACRPTDMGTTSRKGSCEQQPSLCGKQKALSATLVVALVAWLATFAISTLRIVERAVVREQAGRN